MGVDLKIRKIGNSVGVVLPKEVLTHMKLREGDIVYATEAADGSLRLSPTNSKVAKQLEAAQDIISRYRNTLRELAK